MKRCAVALFLLIAGLLRAQDADTIILRNDDRKFTVVSQVEDPQEADAFLAIVSRADPTKREQLAEKFVATYPESWLLAQAYDLLARSAIDLGEMDHALECGLFSLRLLPENPSLLILVANIEAQQNQFKNAVNHAADALQYLNEIERPANLSQKEWSAIRPQLESSAYFAKARSEATQGLASHSAALLKAALDDLNLAAAWNAEDREIFFLRGVVQIQLGEKIAARSDLAFASEEPSPLREKALRILQILAGAGVPVQTFVKGLPSRTVNEHLRNDGPSPAFPDALAAGYAGPKACQVCHEKEYAAWRMTGMARMLQPYRPADIIGDFSTSAEYREGQGTSQAVVRVGSDSRPYFEILNHGTWLRYRVDFTIGSKWQQAYATALPDGRLQVFPIEYNALQKKWINYWRMIDPPGTLRDDIQEFPKMSAATNYQQNCAICHTSQLKADLKSPDPMQHATYLQPGIDCDMCHGPSAWHIRQAKKGASSHENALEPPLDFRKIGNRAGVRACAQCHRQSAVREIGDGGEMNYSENRNFIPATWLRPYDAFSRKAFYKDGRFRETTFIVEAFTRSACYLRGSAQCATCHSPHLRDFEANQTSLKYRADSNEMCLVCHSEYRNRIAEHSHHAARSEASQCLTCHMPRIMNTLLFKARSHQIEIPTADLTARFGPEDSPNVCLTCHQQKDAVWAKQQLAGWRH